MRQFNANLAFSAFNDPGEGDLDFNNLGDLEAPRAIAAAIRQHLVDMQAKNDEAFGQRDAVLNEHVDRINNAITGLQELADRQAREIARARLSGGADTEEELRNNAAQFFSMTTGQRVRANSESLDVDAYRAYRDAFDELVIQGANIERLSPEMRNAMSVGSNPDGGWMVPPERSNEMETRIHDTSPMRNVARIITIGGQSWEAPYKTSKGQSGGWVGERDPRPATGTPKGGMQEIKTHEQYAYPEVTQTMLEDGSDIQSMLVDDTQDEMVRVENLGFVLGDGVLKPRGFLDYAADSVTTVDKNRNWGVLQHVKTGANGGFPTDGSGADNMTTLIDIIAALHPNLRDGATWAMNRLTEADMRKKRDADGRYLIGPGDLQNGINFILHGHPIINFEDMPDIGADTYSAAFGNFRRGYFIIDRRGFNLLVDPYTNKPYVGFYITKRVGGDVRNFDAIKLLKYSA